MMWKDSYQLGVELIDQQHKELFQMVDDLITNLNNSTEWQPKQKYMVALGFMKTYVTNHFQVEEAYQASMGYPGLEEHKKEHAKFTKAILEYEEKLHKTNYDLHLVKELSGVLVAWLIYHVMEKDQQIVKNSIPEPNTQPSSYLECFATSVSHVFETMFGIVTTDITEALEYQNIGSIHATIEFIGDFKGEAVYSFPKDFAFRVMQIMTGMELTEVDEILCSAMAEISNIVSGNAASELVKQGYPCDIRPPIVRFGPFHSNENFPTEQCLAVNTPLGSVYITVAK